jgi:uncharacterized membrane protein YfcA
VEGGQTARGRQRAHNSAHAVHSLAHSVVECRGKQLISDVLGFALLLTAIVLVFRGQIVNWYSAHVGELSEKQTAWFTVMTDATLGVLDSISSIGAGALAIATSPMA